MSVLFDTNIFIDATNGHEIAKKTLLAASDAALSRISWIEVLSGGKSEKERELLRHFLAAWPIVELDALVAEEVVVVRRETKLKLPDAVLLATARVHGRALHTRNTKDFPARWPEVVIPYRLS
ncbi:MAG: PIN domain-containing protein [Pseudomonadota bacterium]